MTLADVGELGLLAELEQRALVEAIEHDAAQIGDLVLTHDTLVDGVHFRLGRVTWRDLGWRVAAVNISDLAASGAEPLALLVSLASPGTTALADVFELYEGIRETGVPVRGGDTTAANELVVGVTAIGRSERVPGRAGAKPGDVLVVTGPLGAAGVAFRDGGFVRPPLRIREGRTLARHAHAMLDLSDGLGADAAQLARRSRCRIEIDLDTVPLAPSATLDDLAFGEDYELLAAVEQPGRFVVIGRCTVGAGVVFRSGGEPVELAGWEHYRKDSSARS